MDQRKLPRFGFANRGYKIKANAVPSVATSSQTITFRSYNQLSMTVTPPYPAHGRAPRVGMLLTNLGTPDAPTASAVRRYLAEFLSDRRVVEISPLVWKIILHGIILRTRPAKSAKKYASVWTSDGSPLLVWTQRQACLLYTSRCV